MAVNKNFVVKNGLEVNSDLIIADSSNKRVGIGSTIPGYTLEVIGGIGVTDINATGIATVKKTLQVGSSGTVISAFESGLVGIGTTNPAYLLDVRTSTGATTGTTVLYVQGDATVTGNLDVAGDIQYDEVTGRNLYISGLSTFVGVSTFESAVGFRTDVFVSGMSTIVGVATFRDDVFVDGNLNVSGDISYDQVTGREIYISGLSTFVGLSSFVSGVYIGGITTTAGSGGITTTGGDLYVGGDLHVKGDAEIIGVLTATSFSGSASIGLSSEGDYIGAGVSLLNLASTNGTAWTISDPSSGVATATVTPGVSLGLAIALGG
jgi:hypothetical protein